MLEYESIGAIRQSVKIADNLFESQIEIDYMEYRLAKGRFLKQIKKIHKLERDSAFQNNYYSENNISWFLLNGTRYFTILCQIGTAIEDRYYGKQIVFFNV
jgi:uncharacterized protein (UPF0128 family)